MSTLWMARYLIELGRETGEGAFWTRAATLLDAMIERLSPLGNSVWAGSRGDDPATIPPRWLHGVWGVHGSLIETILELIGLEYDALEREIRLRPALPPNWPILGLAQRQPCGEVAFRLKRSLGGRRHVLVFDARLDQPVALVVDVTCPGLGCLGTWQGPSTPRFEEATGRLRFSMELAAGDHSIQWAWGDDDEGSFSGV